MQHSLSLEDRITRALVRLRAIPELSQDSADPAFHAAALIAEDAIVELQPVLHAPHAVASWRPPQRGEK